MGWLVSAPCSLISSRNLAGLLHLVVVTKDPRASREGKPQDTNAFQVSPSLCDWCYLLAKASPMAKLKIKMCVCGRGQMSYQGQGYSEV